MSTKRDRGHKETPAADNFCASTDASHTVKGGVFQHTLEWHVMTRNFAKDETPK